MSVTARAFPCLKRAEGKAGEAVKDFEKLKEEPREKSSSGRKRGEARARFK